MRKHWIDNLRWVTVLLVLLYHVIYFYNNKGVFGGVGGFGDGPQYQDVLMYLILTVAVFSLSPLLYEVIRRIPVINWCVLGEKKPCTGNKTTE